MKDERIYTRLSKEEKTALFKLAKKKKIKPSELIRRWIRGDEVLVKVERVMECELKISPHCSGDVYAITERGYTCMSCKSHRLTNTLSTKKKITDEQWELCKIAIANGDDPRKVVKGIPQI